MNTYSYLPAAVPHPPLEDTTDFRGAVPASAKRDAPAVSAIKPIEEAFLHWQSPNQIATQHELCSIYHHAPLPPNRTETEILIANPEIRTWRNSLKTNEGG